MKRTRSWHHPSITRIAFRAFAMVFLLFTPMASSAATNPSAQTIPNNFVEFYHESSLISATTETIIGYRSGDGSCTFAFPALTLAPDEDRIEARQLSIDYTDCTTEIEIGIPRVLHQDPQEGSSTTARMASDSSPTAGGSVLATGSGSGYFKVWWEDPVNLDVHSVTTNISWAWDGTCVNASSGSGNMWWQSWTGWTNTSGTIYDYKSCGYHRHWVNATFQNSIFPGCRPVGIVVTSYYSNVLAEGAADGGLLGWVGSTYTTQSGGFCPPLHWRQQLVRVT